MYYPIYFHNTGYAELQKQLSRVPNIYSSLFILSDTNTYNFCLSRFIKNIPSLETAKVISIKSGEKEKNIENCLYIWRKLSQLGADRNSLLLNLGGGVITDMGGFAASVFKRGITFINIPTTLLAMVDAAIGGKTGIDLDKIKNEIGLFQYPNIIIIDPYYLQSLSPREIKSGMAEILKYGLITDEKLWKKMKEQALNSYITWDNLIFESNIIKHQIITQDPYEKKGLRKILNFGHTIGHGIESYFLRTTTPLLHGESIALGMICESWLSWRLNGLSYSEYQEISYTFLDIYPIREIDEHAVEQILLHLSHDKKNLKGKIRFVLLLKIGQCSYDHEITLDLIRESFTSLKKIKTSHS